MFIYNRLNKYSNDKKGLDIFELAGKPGICVRVYWWQGNNVWSFSSELTYFDIIQNHEKAVTDIIANLINLRDTKIESIKFWTNCDVI